MQRFYLLCNIGFAIALLVLGLVALVKNYRLKLNQLFALFALSISVWILAAYISNDIANPQEVSLIGNYIVFLFSYLAAYLLLVFSILLAEDKVAKHRVRYFYLPIIIVGVLSITPLVVKGVHIQGTVYAVDFGPLAVPYGIAITGLLVSASVILKRNIKHASGTKRHHLQILYRSMIIALPLLLLTQFILPAVTGWFGLTNIGILAMSIPVVGLYYSVVKFRLFNLKLIVVRSVTYVIAVGLIGLLFSYVSFRLITTNSGHLSTTTQEILNVLLIGLAITAFAPILRLFRRATNNFFYKDAYDVQELFGELNQAIVSTLDLHRLLKRTSETIAMKMKVQFVFFDIYGPGQDIVVGSGSTMGQAQIASFQELLRKNKDRTIITDNLSTGYLAEELKNNDIGAVVWLIGEVDKAKPVGYMFVGIKKSGSAFNAQDAMTMQTIANELTIAIQNALHFEEIQQFNITLQERVEQATKELRKTNDKLKKLDETKDEFISMASHQLRTPLTSVKGYLSMVLEGDAGELNDLQRQLLGQSYSSSQRMVYLISDLLNLSRLNTGKFVIEPAEVDLREVVAAEIDQLRETAKSRGVSIVYNAPQSFPVLMLDETKTHQVVMNFLDNAIYYTPTGGEVHVSLVETATAVEYRVKDSGIGVPRSEQHRLFSKFYRAENARRVRPDGTGLGLFMSKKVVVAQGGSIIFESEEGKGSTFGFRFGKAGHAVAPPRPNQQ